MACLELEESFTYLATQRVSMLGKEAGGYGGTIFALRSTGVVRNVSDIPGKIIGVGNVWAPGGFCLPRKVCPYRPMRNEHTPEFVLHVFHGPSDL